MVAPVLLFGGIAAAGALLMAMGGKKSLEADTLKALKTEDPAKVNLQAGRFDALNDAASASLLRALADRMVNAKGGATLPPAHAVDPDNSGEPAVAEWTGTLLTNPFTDAQLIRWADAYESLHLPGAAKLLRDKAALPDTPVEPTAPELSEALQAQVNELLAANDDPFAMETLAKTVREAGRGDIADELIKHAGSIRDQWRADEEEAAARGEVFEDTGLNVTPQGNTVPATTANKPPTSAPSDKLPATLPQATLDAIAAALASGDAKKMQDLADGLENVGATVPAQQLRARAIEILAATPKPAATKPVTTKAGNTGIVPPKLPTAPKPVVTAPKPVVVAPKPVAAPVATPKPVAALPVAKPTTAVPATHTVKSGESPWSVATYYTGNGTNWKALVNANPQYPVDAKTGSFKNFYAGMVLKIPAGWQAPQASANSKYELAQKVNANLLSAAANKEDKTLVKSFQLQEGAARVGTPDGLAGPKTSLAIASYGIIPAKPRYWSSKTKTSDMAAYKKVMTDYANKDPLRAAEWLAAGKV